MKIFYFLKEKNTTYKNSTKIIHNFLMHLKLYFFKFLLIIKLKKETQFKISNMEKIKKSIFALIQEYSEEGIWLDAEEIEET